MATLSRADTSTLGRWWWTVDRWTLFSIIILIGFGYVLVLAASPAVAERIHQSRDIFILKQLVFLAMAGGVILAVSLMSPSAVRRIAIIGCVDCPGPDLVDAFPRCGDQGCAALDRLAGHVDPAERIPQALLSPSSPPGC